MRDLVLTLVLLALPFCTSAAQKPEAPDTVKIIKNAEKVIVSRSGETTLIEVDTRTDSGKGRFSYTVTVEDSIAGNEDSSFEFELPFGIGKDKAMDKGRQRIKTSVFTFGNAYAGQRFNYYDKGNVKNSFEAGVRDVIGIRWSRGAYSPSFSIGIGGGCKCYRAQDGFVYTRFGSELMLVPVEDGCTVKSTYLVVTNFQIPLLATIPIGSEVKFTFGGIGSFNTYARAYTEVTTGTTRIKTTYKDLQQRLFTAEAMCALGVCDIFGVYASWSPMTLFQAPYGPQLKSWSIGATINF